MKRRDLVRCAILGSVAFYAVEAFHNLADVLETIGRLKNVRVSEGVSELPLAPYVWWLVRYLLFCAAAGAATGVLLGLVAYLLVRPERTDATNEGGGSLRANRTPLSPSALRKRLWWVFAALLAVFLIYVHLRMVTLYPSLFRRSYRYAWFAGSPFWVVIVQSVGRIAPILLVLYLARKHRHSIASALRRHPRRLAAVATACLIALGGWWASRLPSRAASINQGPNVIIIALDSVRPDYLSWKGLRSPYRLPTTPRIDKFLDDAVWFEQAFVPLARTLPSWMSILTGCWPPTHGVRFDLPPRDMLVPEVPTLPQVLQRAGYTTAFVLDNTNFAWMEPPVGFDHILQPRPNAVDFYISSMQPATMLYYYFLNNRLGFLYDRGLRGNAAYRAVYRPEFTQESIARLVGRLRSEPKCFAAIHLCSIHVPFCVSYPYSTMFRPTFGPVLNRFGYRPLLEQILLKKERKREFSEEETIWIFNQEINLYRALVRSADDSFGAIIDTLQKAGLYDNSYIVFLADHGEHLPESGLRYLYGSSTHGFFLWGDQDTHVPLAIKFPQARYRGKRVDRLVRTIDVAPTLLDALGLPPLPSADGVSRMGDVRGESDERDRWTFAETGLSARKLFVPNHLDYQFHSYPELHEVDPKTLKIYRRKSQMPNLITAKDRMIRTERWKLIAYPLVKDGELIHGMELFDLTADPNNCSDVATSYPLVMQQLEKQIRPFIERDIERWGTGPIKGIGTPDKSRVPSTRF